MLRVCLTAYNYYNILFAPRKFEFHIKTTRYKQNDNFKKKLTT